MNLKIIKNHTNAHTKCILQFINVENTIYK